MNASDLAYFFGNDIFNINLLGLGEVILWLLRLSNSIFIHLEKIFNLLGIAEKIIRTSHDHEQYF